MGKTQFDGGHSRRELFPLATAAGIALLTEAHAFGAADFWNRKKPAEWSDEEKDEIRKKSPWAKQVDAETSGGDRGGGGERGGDGERGGGGGTVRGGGNAGGADRGGGGSLAPAANFGPATKLTIVWQSAKPIQDAHPIALPAKLDNHYVISVSGIPPRTLTAILGGRGRGEGGEGAPPDPTAVLRSGTTLTVKGKEPQKADILLSMNQNATLVFGFPKETLPIAAGDKDPEFVIKLPGLTAKAKFSLKDMMYGEQLAV
jgi:hypothetical protein